MRRMGRDIEPNSDYVGYLYAVTNNGSTRQRAREPVLLDDQVRARPFFSAAHRALIVGHHQVRNPDCRRYVANMVNAERACGGEHIEDSLVFRLPSFRQLSASARCLRKELRSINPSSLSALIKRAAVMASD